MITQLEAFNKFFLKNHMTILFTQEMMHNSFLIAVYFCLQAQFIQVQVQHACIMYKSTVWIYVFRSLFCFISCQKEDTAKNLSLFNV